MSHFTTEQLSYKPQEYKSRLESVAMMFIISITSVVSWVVLLLVALLGGSSQLVMLSSLVVLIAPVVITLRMTVRSFEKFKRLSIQRSYIRGVYKNLLGFKERFTMPLAPVKAPFTIDIRSSEFKDTLLMTVQHDDPMMMPWRYQVSKTAIFSSDSAPAFRQVYRQLDMLMHDITDGRSQALEVLGKFFRAPDTSIVTPELSEARALMGDD